MGLEVWRCWEFGWVDSGECGLTPWATVHTQSPLPTGSECHAIRQSHPWLQKQRSEHHAAVECSVSSELRLQVLWVWSSVGRCYRVLLEIADYCRIWRGRKLDIKRHFYEDCYKTTFPLVTDGSILCKCALVSSTPSLVPQFRSGGGVSLHCQSRATLLLNPFSHEFTSDFFSAPAYEFLQY